MTASAAASPARSASQIGSSENPSAAAPRHRIEKKMPIRVSVSPVGSVDEVSLRKILEIYGVSYRDIRGWGGKVFFAGYSNAASLLKDRHVDYAVSILALPAAYLLDAKMGRSLQLLTYSDEVLDRMQEDYAYSKGIIPKSVYPDMMDHDVMTPVMGTVVICHKSVPEDVVYAITKALCENKDRLPAIHKSMEVFEPETAWKGSAAPLHPGAERYYKEQGYMK